MKSSKRIYLGKETKSLGLLPNLVEHQLFSYDWFWDVGFKELLEEISPIKDVAGRGFELHLEGYELEKPKHTEQQAKEKMVSYEVPIRLKTKLVFTKQKKEKEQEVYLGEFPLMTDKGTFIINGNERVIVSQLIRSEGVLFTEKDTGKGITYGAKIIPNRGAWLEIETDHSGVIWVKIDRKRKIPITSLIRAFGIAESDKEIFSLFKGIDTNKDKQYIQNTILKDPSKSQSTGLQEVYKRIRPGELATEDNARQMIENMFFNFARYDLGKVGRYKLNQRLSLKRPNDVKNRIFSKADFIEIIKEIVRLNNDPDSVPDDIDHLGNRRVRLVGELIQGRIRKGFARLERIVKDRMSTLAAEEMNPAQLINSRPIMGIIKTFFSSSQLSQYMDQTNPLTEVEHKRRLSSLGAGGLSREHAGLSVRDVHPSHYGRICVIHTPEGPNVGLITQMASFTRVNEYGFLEAPYHKILHKKNEHFISKDVEYLNAFRDDRTTIATANIQMDANRKIETEKVVARIKGEPKLVDVAEVDYVDIELFELTSMSANLVPFMEYNNSDRVLMGANTQKQAVPTVKAEAPLVGTGLEEKVATDSGLALFAEDDGTVTEADANGVKVKYKKAGNRKYKLKVLEQSNNYTCVSHKPRVKKGDVVKKGDLLADSHSMEKGELALGQNVLVAIMPFRGYNYEDAIIISQSLASSDKFSSIHIEDFIIDVRDTKLGPEVTTPDIPNVAMEKLENLDEEGIIRVGAEVSSGDILVGKITPRGESDLTAEERLLRAVFGEKSRDVKDSSLRLQHGEKGKIVDIKIFSREAGDQLPSGVIKSVKVSIAKMRSISVGDKLIGRHGNKGCISIISPDEDMPYMADGRQVDMILNSVGIPKRMNIGQIMEMHLGLAADKLGYTVACPPFGSPTEDMVRAELKKAGYPEDGKLELFDGKTGKAFDDKVAVGYMYMLKLSHIVEDKIHMRSIGPYSLITQQPLGGRAQFGGQRFGEMEVWALEGYGASHMLQEMLTIKSDDVVGRSKAYESIIKGEQIQKPNIPTSFHVLISELRGLGLDVELTK